MPFENLIAHIRQRADAYGQPTALEGIAHDLADALRVGAPKDTGVLAEAVSEVGPINQEAVGILSIGVGNQQRLGYPNEDAPEKTIWDFLQTEEGKKFRTKEVSSLPGWDKRLAWWFLPQEGRDALQAARAGGLFGGPEYNAGDRSPYYGVQSQELPEWSASAFGAGLEGKGTRFTVEALEAWRERLPELIGRYLLR